MELRLETDSRILEWLYDLPFIGPYIIFGMHMIIPLALAFLLTCLVAPPDLMAYAAERNRRTVMIFGVLMPCWEALLRWRKTRLWYQNIPTSVIAAIISLVCLIYFLHNG